MPFDILEYKRRTGPIEFDDLDFRHFEEHPLPEPVLRCIGAMHDVEFHTVCYLRDLLVTPAHADPEITAFLCFWNHEEFWHGEALAAVLAAHGEQAGAPRVELQRRSLGWRDIEVVDEDLGRTRHDRREVAARLVEDVGGHPDRRQGRAKLMGDVGGEPALDQVLMWGRQGPRAATFAAVADPLQASGSHQPGHPFAAAGQAEPEA